MKATDAQYAQGERLAATVDLHRVVYFHKNGGHRVSGPDSLRLHAPDPKGDEPIVTAEKAEGLALAVLIVAGVIGAVLIVHIAYSARGLLRAFFSY